MIGGKARSRVAADVQDPASRGLLLSLPNYIGCVQGDETELVDYGACSGVALDDA